MVCLIQAGVADHHIEFGSVTLRGLIRRFCGATSLGSPMASVWLN